MMADGTLRRVEEVREGDFLMGPDSTFRRVLGTISGFGKLFRVDQAGGGISYIVNEAHILSLQKSHATYFRSDRGYWDERHSAYGKLVNLPVSEYIGKSSKWKSYFFGYKTSSIEFDVDESLPIDPYFLGMWLGDGTSRELRLTVHEDDWSIINYCRDYVERFDLGISVCTKEGVAAYDVGFPKKSNKLTNDLWAVFKRLGLDNDKHIPWQFAVASEKDRLSLLAGLIDSDGYCNHNGYEFTNTNIEIVQKAKLIADLLGFKTNLRVKRANGRDRLSDAFTLSINGDVWRIPCLLPRKQVQESEVSKNKDFLLRAVTVVPIADGEYFGFDLDGDHLFLLEDGTVTHNSWGVSRALLIIGTQRPIRVLCARELQNSIADSVHQLLRDQITALGLDGFYEVQQARILGKNGTSFAFEGIKNNVNKIKSYEGIDYCWVEEANKVSRNSWSILIPTIRKELSEIWLTFNPELDTDYTYVRFVKEADPESMSVVKMTWRDNEWFPQVLMEEKEADRKRDYDHYLNIWEGHCLQMLEGAIFAKELRKAQEERRICNVPWDREYPVDTFWDLGRADQTAIWFGQRVAMQYRVLAYFSDSMQDITYYLRECQSRGYVYGTFHLPHDAKAKQLGSKRSIEELVRQAGYRVSITRKLSVPDGINAARLIFSNCWFDEDLCSDGLDALRHYRYRVVDGQLSNEPLHDWASDGADAFRNLAVAMQSPREPSRVGERLAAATQAIISRKRGGEFSGRSSSGGHFGWMR